MDFSRRSYQKELLDHDDIPFSDIKRNMEELNFINTYLGGHAITVAGLRKILRRYPFQADTEILICEIGCGGGDNLLAIDAWCKKQGLKAAFIGIDINGDCIEVATESCRQLPATFIHADYKDVEFGEKPAIIFSSLFCHHFDNNELIQMLQWMNKNTTNGFFINDLHRHPLAYYSIKWLSQAFSKSYLVKNDAPLSVARAFTRGDLLTLLNSAKIVEFTIEWKWAFRWLVTANNKQEASFLRTQSQPALP
jgi:2-polyprenyl-3-methyl-5-hydroxy-6-metoxy-1,4-benzoquinol methylase